MARIAFQLAREVGVRDFDQALVCLMSEVVVVFLLVSSRLLRVRRFRFPGLSADQERAERREE